MKLFWWIKEPVKQQLYRLFTVRMLKRHRWDTLHPQCVCARSYRQMTPSTNMSYHKMWNVVKILNVLKWKALDMTLSECFNQLHMCDVRLPFIDGKCVSGASMICVTPGAVIDASGTLIMSATYEWIGFREIKLPTGVLLFESWRASSSFLHSKAYFGVACVHCINCKYDSFNVRCDTLHGYWLSDTWCYCIDWARAPFRIDIETRPHTICRLAGNVKNYMAATQVSR